jgi:uncharacterized protein (TIGR02996 family)
MSLHEAFLQAIRETPQDDTPRLIYADWLDENGECDRAAFIRTQCRLAHLEKSAPVAASLRGLAESLLSKHWKEWVAPLRPLLGPKASRHGEHLLLGSFRPECLDRFRRGFIESLALDVERFVAHSATLARHVPLLVLGLWGAGRDSGAFASVRYLRGVALLRFCDYFEDPLRDTGAKALARSEHLSYLRELHLYGNHLGEDGVTAIAGAPWLEQLETLHLSNNSATPAACMSLAEARMARLRNLYFARNWVGDRGLQALADADWFGQLQILDLHESQIEQAGIDDFASAPHQGALQALDLSKNPIGAEGARLLAGATILETVVALKLSRCDLGDGGVAALLGSPHLSRLQRLSLDDNHLTDRVVEVLATCPNLPQLELLNLHGNALSADAVAGLIHAPHLPRLRSLHLMEPAPLII